MPDILPDAEDLLARLAHAIASELTPETALVGIHTGGAWIAERLHAQLDIAQPLGVLDISFYRDDFSRIGLHPQVKPSRIPFQVEDRPLIVVDDVLYTGRTVRAAMNELFDYGRPASIRLAVLVDRGGRELPICADFAGVRVDLPSDRNLQLDRAADGRLSLSQRNP
ncbi:MAG TPA: bifunctional pyr operon transcriptional regulator/uracil phosphoribosyltransferase PyrR [Thiobacillaceae bacterium]|nr:bifunctional pyr operon transcriptional regulator/uracil phosphoribosyltransferase PyrR [Thiobacillaceae bacterium]